MGLKEIHLNYLELLHFFATVPNVLQCVQYHWDQYVYHGVDEHVENWDRQSVFEKN
jgi:hypothetical protein